MSMTIFWETVKGLTEVQVDNILFSPLVYQASHFQVYQVYQVGQCQFYIDCKKREELILKLGSKEEYICSNIKPKGKKLSF